ncbi:peptide chain release factor-like protein [Candidatus Vidania fulgoroideorum]
MKKEEKYIKKKIFLIKKIKKNKKNRFFSIIKEILKKKVFMKIKHSFEKKTMETIFMEIREGIGGTESEIFTKDIFLMYKRYLELKNFLYDFLVFKTSKNGVKRIILRAKGKNIFKILKDETGVHRIQRIPKTENKGRVHTSTCIVEVYKEEPKQIVEINKKELRIETFKSSGPGGQSVNKTNSAVRIIHIPTGISVECQKERSQIENKRYAMNLLKAKLFSLEDKKEKIISKSRRNKNKKNFSTRSNKIRTYNLAKNKITNHINGRTTNKIKEILNGNLDILF